jgi:ABC-type uncharacterized transport system permease subunit
MQIHFLQSAIIISVLASTLRIATPLLLAAMGELVVEHAGVFNLGIEGMVLTGAYISFLVAYDTHSLILATVGAILAGGLVGALLALFVTTLKADQTVSGLAMDLLASGITLFWYRVKFGDMDVSLIPTVKTAPILEIPVLSRIPFLGEIFFSQRLLTYVAFLSVPLVAVILKKTRFGLAIRSLGENPRAVDMRGLNVDRLQWSAVVFGGMMAGLAGSFLSIGTTVRFIPEMSGGRGFLALIMLIAGSWKPGRILLVALFFAVLDAGQLQLQGMGVPGVPYELLLAIPYIAAILILLGSGARSAAPKHLGIPYKRE